MNEKRERNENGIVFPQASLFESSKLDEGLKGSVPR